MIDKQLSIPAKHLSGTEVQVYKQGQLLSKPSLLSPKRPCTVELKGTELTIQDTDQGKVRVLNIANAKLMKQTVQKRLVLQLSSKEKMSLYATDKDDLEDWIEALTDSIEWRVQRFYEIGPELGRGAFASVRKGKHKTSAQVVAIKIINKSCCGQEELTYLQREVDIALCLGHRNVVRTSQVFESDKRLYLVQEYMSGGTLEKFIQRNGPQGEDVAWQIMSDVFAGVAYLHSSEIVHRDLKPENILCSGKRAPMTAKVMDFGLSRHTKDRHDFDQRSNSDGLGPEGLMTTPVGTPGFVAPEVLLNVPYGKEVDVFACGVIMYFVLCGYLPFYHAEAGRLAELIKKAKFDFPEKEWREVSSCAKDLITRMLERSPYARISVEEALAHPWMKANAAAQVRRRKTTKVREEQDLHYVDAEVFDVRENTDSRGSRALSAENVLELKSPRSAASTTTH